jgi:ABC-2 type transport system permease protein
MLLLAYSITVFIGTLIFTALGAYNTLALVDKIEYLPSVAILIAAITIFAFGITSVATNYYSGPGDEQFFAMPLSITDIFRAKFAVSFTTDALLGILVFSIFSVVYAAKEGLLGNPLFYLGLIVTFIAFSVVFLAIIYLIFILVLLYVPKLRKKSFLTGVATGLLIAFIAIYSYMIGFGVGSQGVDLANANQAVLPIALRLAVFAEKCPTLLFVSGALSGKVLPIIILAAISAAVIFGLLPLLGKLYAKTLAGFSDVKSKKLTAEKASQLISRDTKTNTAFKALLIRDIRTILREPAFFANGPLIVVLMPIILIFSLAIPLLLENEYTLAQLITAVQLKCAETSPESLQKIYYAAAMGLSAGIVFVGVNTNVAATAFSREGKGLSNLKAMPFTFETLLKVKFWHSMIYVFVESAFVILLLALANVIFAVIVPWTLLFKLMVLIVISSSAVSLPLIFADLLIDIANPKLNWENPTAAFKQNFNSLFGMLASMALIAIGAGLAYLLPKNYMSLLYLAAVFGIIGAPLGSWYFRYGEKKLRVL